MKVVYIQRKPLPHRHFSIEKSFAETRRHLPEDIEARVFVPHFQSRGILRRLLIAGEAAASQGDLNHVTGDIHFAALALRGRKTVLTILDCVSLHRTSGLRRRVLMEFWYRLPMAHVAAITTISHFSRAELLSTIPCPPSKVHVVPACVPPLESVPKPELSDPPVILQVGTTPNKNLDRLAAALEGVPCLLRIVGVLSEAQHEMLRRHGINYAAVSGVSDLELARLYAEADVVAFVSTYEGFGMPVIEAQCVGRPVITSTAASLPEVAGDGACCVDPYDVPAIRRAFIEVLRNPEYRRSLVAAGFVNHTRFSPASIAQQYAALYRSLHA